MSVKRKRDCDPATFLATIGEGRRSVSFQKKKTVFAQGDQADAVFYIQAGKVKLTVVSENGKEATVGILNVGDFFGEGALAGQLLRMGSATAMTDCEILQIDKKAMTLALHREHTFSDLFVAHLLARNIRYIGCSSPADGLRTDRRTYVPDEAQASLPSCQFAEFHSPSWRLQIPCVKAVQPEPLLRKNLRHSICRPLLPCRFRIRPSTSPYPPEYKTQRRPGPLVRKPIIFFEKKQLSSPHRSWQGMKPGQSHVFS